MKTKSFSFDLPEELVAQYPSDRREEARLMVLERGTGAIGHHSVYQLPDLLPRNSLIVFNDSRVRKARIIAGRRASGAEVEMLFVEPLEARRWLVTVNKAKRQRPGTVYDLPGALEGEIVEVRESYRVLEVSEELTEAYFERHGHVPLPPYIARKDTAADESRYQTIFADRQRVGSIAAPTAGLHFTDELMSRLRARGHEIAFVTLHVGLGTFLPVRTEKVEDHTMHEERFSVPRDTAELVNQARETGQPIVAVGTTTVRSLESAALQCEESQSDAHGIRSGAYRTRLFVYPGFKFRIVTSMFTNFHTPESSLLMLVSAFAGRERLLSAYREAIRMRYRFYSYGDAMLIRE